MKCGAKRGLVPVLILIVSFSGYAQSSSQPDHDQAVAAAASSATPKGDLSGKVHDDSFVIGSEDVLSINVWKEPELTKSVPVRSDGKISLPLVGEMMAAGRTPLQLERDITAKLQNFITTPEVTVMVEKVNSKKFNILGQVTKPGSYSLATASTVVDAIAAAGGFRDFAKKTGVYILRTNPDGTQSRIPFNYKEFIKGKNPGQNVKLEPNDSVIVP